MNREFLFLARERRLIFNKLTSASETGEGTSVEGPVYDPSTKILTDKERGQLFIEEENARLMYGDKLKVLKAEKEALLDSSDANLDVFRETMTGVMKENISEFNDFLKGIPAFRGENLTSEAFDNNFLINDDNDAFQSYKTEVLNRFEGLKSEKVKGALAMVFGFDVKDLKTNIPLVAEFTAQSMRMKLAESLKHDFSDLWKMESFSTPQINAEDQCTISFAGKLDSGFNVEISKAEEYEKRRATLASEKDKLADATAMQVKENQILDTLKGSTFPGAKALASILALPMGEKKTPLIRQILSWESPFWLGFLGMLGLGPMNETYSQLRGGAKDIAPLQGVDNVLSQWEEKARNIFGYYGEVVKGLSANKFLEMAKVEGGSEIKESVKLEDRFEAAGNGGFIEIKLGPSGEIVIPKGASFSVAEGKAPEGSAKSAGEQARVLKGNDKTFVVAMLPEGSTIRGAEKISVYVPPETPAKTS